MADRVLHQAVALLVATGGPRARMELRERRLGRQPTGVSSGRRRCSQRPACQVCAGQYPVTRRDGRYIEPCADEPSPSRWARRDHGMGRSLLPSADSSRSIAVKGLIFRVRADDPSGGLPGMGPGLIALGPNGASCCLICAHSSARTADLPLCERVLYISPSVHGHDTC